MLHWDTDENCLRMGKAQCILYRRYTTVQHNAFNSSPLVLLYASANWVSIGSDKGLSPVRRQAITWTNADVLSETKFREIRIKIQNVYFTKIHLKMSSAKWRPFCPGGDDLKDTDEQLSTKKSKYLPTRVNTGTCLPGDTIASNNIRLVLFCFCLTACSERLYDLFIRISTMAGCWSAMRFNDET